MKHSRKKLVIAGAIIAFSFSVVLFLAFESSVIKENLALNEVLQSDAVIRMEVTNTTETKEHSCYSNIESDTNINFANTTEDESLNFYCDTTVIDSPTPTPTPSSSPSPSHTPTPTVSTSPTTEPTVTPTSPPGAIDCGPIDVNDDQNLTIIDFSAFARVYRTGNTLCNYEVFPENTCGGKDVNADGKVNLVDFGGTPGLSFASRYNLDSCLIDTPISNQIDTPAGDLVSDETILSLKFIVPIESASIEYSCEAIGLIDQFDVTNVSSIPLYKRTLVRINTNISGTDQTFLCETEYDFEPTPEITNTPTLTPTIDPGELYDPAGMGPYPIGVITLDLVDESRVSQSSFPDPLKVKTEVWYPATEEARNQVNHVYTINDFLSEEAQNVITEPLNLSLETKSVQNAQARTQDGPYPIVFFSHGTGGLRLQSLYLTQMLASHGYIVVAPDHDNDTMSNYVIRGGVDPIALLESFIQRPKDIDFLVTQLEIFNQDQGHALEGLLDLEHKGIIGHSYGSITAIRSAGYRDDIDVVIGQTLTNYPLAWVGMPVPLNSIGASVMLQIGGMDQTADPNDDSMWLFMAAPRSSIRIKSAGHFTFSDMCTLDPYFINIIENYINAEITEDGCGADNIDPEIAFNIIRNYSVALLNVELKNDDRYLVYLDEQVGNDYAPGEVIMRWDP